MTTKDLPKQEFPISDEISSIKQEDGPNNHIQSNSVSRQVRNSKLNKRQVQTSQANINPKYGQHSLIQVSTLINDKSSKSKYTKPSIEDPLNQIKEGDSGIFCFERAIGQTVENRNPESSQAISPLTSSNNFQKNNI